MKTKLYRVHHIMGNLCIFATSNHKAGELFVTEWQHRFGDAPGSFSIEELVSFKIEGEFSRHTRNVMRSGAEGIGFYSEGAGWTVYQIGEERDDSPIRI